MSSLGILSACIVSRSGTDFQNPAEKTPDIEEIQKTTPSREITIRPTPTLTQHSQTTVTGDPTLDPMKARARLKDLFSNNAGCQLPCWWGITPGETDWETAYQDLVQFSLFIEQGGVGENVEGGKLVVTTNYTAYYEVGTSDNIGHTSFGIENQIVVGIEVDRVGTELAYTLPQLLSSYGPPTEVWVRTYPRPIGESGFYLPLFLRLFYQDLSFVAMYSDNEATLLGNHITGCFLNGPDLRIWDPIEQYTFSEIFDPWNLGISGLPLLEASGMTIEEFVDAFSDPNYYPCLETEASLWTIPGN